MESEHQQLMGALRELIVLVSEQARALDTIAAQLLALRGELQPRDAVPAPQPARPPKEPAADGVGLEIPRRQAPRI